MAETDKVGFYPIDYRIASDGLVGVVRLIHETTFQETRETFAFVMNRFSILVFPDIGVPRDRGDEPRAGSLCLLEETHMPRVERIEGAEDQYSLHLS